MIILVVKITVKHDDMDADLGMIVYSALLALALVVSSPVWLWRMAANNRYREGLGQRLGQIPAALLQAVQGKRVVWLHAVSVGETLAAVRLVGELGTALGGGWIIVISTTTATGQKVAQERFGAGRVFYYPLDFAWIVRRYLRALRPELLILMESELWPRMLVECERATIPVTVVNARISDRSFPRYMRLRSLWKSLFAKVTLFLAQGEETAERLKAIGASASKISVSGNLKYDGEGGGNNAMTKRIGQLLWQSRVLAAGSTAPGEEEILLSIWPSIQKAIPDAVLLIAPRHPERFDEVLELIRQTKYPWFRCTHLKAATEPIFGGTILLLDTIGDLASMYGLASAAFVGGSLVGKGGQNPIEATRFGIPVIMGPSYENFREVVNGMISTGAVRIVDRGTLAAELIATMSEPRTNGAHFKGQTGATERTLQSLLGLLK